MQKESEQALIQALVDVCVSQLVHATCELLHVQSAGLSARCIGFIVECFIIGHN